MSWVANPQGALGAGERHLRPSLPGRCKLATACSHRPAASRGAQRDPGEADLASLASLRVYTLNGIWEGAPLAPYGLPRPLRPPVK